MQAPVSQPVVVSGIDWNAIITLAIANAAAILMAMAFLVSVMKGNFKALNEKVDGHLGRMLDALQTSKVTEGKVEALLSNTKTNVIADRRKDKSEE